MALFFFLALITLAAAASICHITIVVQAFAHEESGWGLLLIVFGGCTPLVLWYGWTRAAGWGTQLLMIAYTVSLIAYLVALAVFLSPLLLFVYFALRH